MLSGRPWSTQPMKAASIDALLSNAGHVATWGLAACPIDCVHNVHRLGSLLLVEYHNHTAQLSTFCWLLCLVCMFGVQHPPCSATYVHFPTSHMSATILSLSTSSAMHDAVLICVHHRDLQHQPMMWSLQNARKQFAYQLQTSMKAELCLLDLALALKGCWPGAPCPSEATQKGPQLQSLSHPLNVIQTPHLLLVAAR